LLNIAIYHYFCIISLFEKHGRPRFNLIETFACFKKHKVTGWLRTMQSDHSNIQFVTSNIVDKVLTWLIYHIPVDPKSRKAEKAEKAEKAVKSIKQ
jgi:hypothetical protein